MMTEECILDGYLFTGKEACRRARKEKEVITYLTAHTDSSDGRTLLKIYNRSVEQRSFQTVIGLHYLSRLRQHLIQSGIVSEDILAPIPAAGGAVPRGKTEELPSEHEAEMEGYYEGLYEDAKVNARIKDLLIGVLICVIVGMVAISVLG